MRFLSKIFNLNDPGWGRGQGSNGSEPPKNGQQPPNRPPQQNGPPDLDQVWRDFNQRLGSLFGRKQGGGHGSGDQNPGGFGGPSARQSRIGLGVIVAVVGAVLRAFEVAMV